MWFFYWRQGVNIFHSTLNQAKISLNKITPPRTKGHRRDSDVIFVGEEDCLQKRIVVKVRYLTKVHRIQMKLVRVYLLLLSCCFRFIIIWLYSINCFIMSLIITPLETNVSGTDNITTLYEIASPERGRVAPLITLSSAAASWRNTVNAAVNTMFPTRSVFLSL